MGERGGSHGDAARVQFGHVVIPYHVVGVVVVIVVVVVVVVY